MLYNGVNHFNWQANNFSDSYLMDAGEGTTLTADGAAHTKGSNTALLSGIAHDCWGISLAFSSGSTDATIRRQMVDLLIDPAAGVGNAGSSWSVLINNLFMSSPLYGAAQLGHNFYFPLFLPAGTAIGACTQDVVGSGSVKCFIRVHGQPTRPDLVKVGHVVQTIGATTASTSGVAVTPGSQEHGSYTASMGTLTRDAWWWQVGWGTGDGSMTGNTGQIEIAHDATSKYTCARGFFWTSSSSELAGKSALGEGLPIRHAPAGTDVYVRMSGHAGPDSSNTVVVYAVT
jgi:hypothetical protein